MKIEYCMNFMKKIFKTERKLNIDSIKEDNADIETKYFKKYRDLLNQKNIVQLLEEYKTGQPLYEPPRKNITDSDMDSMYAKIDESNLLTRPEKLESIIGLMMILDGSFPNTKIRSQLGKVCGKNFIDVIEKKHDEFNNEIAIQRIIKYLDDNPIAIKKVIKFLGINPPD